MTRYLMLCAMMTAALVLVGCSGKEEPAPAKPAAKATDAAVKDIEAQVAKIMDLIKENKLDDADAQLKAVEAKMGSVPKAVQDQIKATRDALAAAKAAAGKIEMPQLPTLPK